METKFVAMYLELLDTYIFTNSVYQTLFYFIPVHPKSHEEFPRKSFPVGVFLCFILVDRREICMPESFAVVYIFRIVNVQIATWKLGTSRLLLKSKIFYYEVLYYRIFITCIINCPVVLIANKHIYFKEIWEMQTFGNYG